MITITESRSRSGRTAVDLVVELLSPTTIVVLAGTFRIQSTDLTFTEDQLWELLAPPSVKTYVTGYLVRENSSGNPFLLVDTIGMDGEDVAYEFEGSPYAVLHMLYRFVMAPLTASLSGLDINVHHVVKELS